MKKVAVVTVILVMITALGSVCGADEKKGYVVRSITTITLPPGQDGSQGESFCRGNDFVTGCSYVLGRYPGCTSLLDYAFPVVQPIECSEDKQGFRVCTGCRVVVIPPDVDLLPPSCNATPLPLEIDLWVYAYCGNPPKK
jgi:hypothetical protein